jgi:hypothetical protein
LFFSYVAALQDSLSSHQINQEAQMISQSLLQKVVLLIVMSIVAACGRGTELPTVGEILAEPGTTIMPGEKANLTIAVSGTDLIFEWTALRGSISNPTQATVIYTAPGSPGLDTVTVKITNSGGEIIRSITFEVVVPPLPTETETPIPADTPTAVPEPIACNLPVVTKNLFPQLADVQGQFPIYGPIDPRFVCEAAYGIVHDKPLAVHIAYENVDNNFGWWGIATPNGYDTASYSEICFWAFAQQPNQSFRLKLKDINQKEKGVIIILEEANQWKQICTDLTKFSDLGIALGRLENVNLGFEQPTGSAEIWIADFEFR